MPRQHNIQHDAMNEPLNTDSAVAAARSSRATTCLREALAIFVGGVGLLTDSYDFAIINLVRADLAKLYPVDDFENSWQRSMITASSIFGAMGGQLLLGYLADSLGRRRLLLISGGLTFAGALGSACAFDFGSDHVGLWASLIGWRFVMGFGIGGEYPLSAAHTAEHSRQGESGVRLACLHAIWRRPVLAALNVCSPDRWGSSGLPGGLRLDSRGSLGAVGQPAIPSRKELDRFERVQQERQAIEGNGAAADARRAECGTRTR